jgi:hypothetical protein
VFWVSTCECFATCDDRAWVLVVWCVPVAAGRGRQNNFPASVAAEGDVKLCGMPSCCRDQSCRGVWRSDRVTCDEVLEIEKKKKNSALNSKQRAEFQSERKWVFSGFWAKRVTCRACDLVSFNLDGTK